jgi:LuxR family maltose regulon positive regulatory protein
VAPPVAAAARPAPAADTPRPPAVRGMVLTPKEREVMELLARSLSNKEIGRAMQVGETTVKWHVKNLLAKLDAGTRKEVVVRARILGLLQPAP